MHHSGGSSNFALPPHRPPFLSLSLFSSSPNSCFYSLVTPFYFSHPRYFCSFFSHSSIRFLTIPLSFFLLTPSSPPQTLSVRPSDRLKRARISPVDYHTTPHTHTHIHTGTHSHIHYHHIYPIHSICLPLSCDLGETSRTRSRVSPISSTAD